MSDRDPYTFHEHELADIPMFPLPKVVLFPGTRLPLHIFEPRYRDMMADCVVDGTDLMVMAQLGGEWKEAYHGTPAVQQVAGLGRIEWQRRNDDGTYDLQLLGIARVRLFELPMANRSYRRVRAERLHDRAPAAGLGSSALSTLYTQAQQTAALVRAREERFRVLASPADAPGVMLDKLADQFVGDPAARQQLLETLDLAERQRLVSTQLAHLQLVLMGDSGRTLQ